MDANQQFEKMAADLTAAAKKNPGAAHAAMISHLYVVRDGLLGIIHEAEDLEFHDYANEKYAMPKMQLVMSLEEIRKAIDMFNDRVKNGTYDNDDPMNDA